MDESKGSVTSTSSDDSNMNASFSTKMETNFKQEKLGSPSQNMYTENMHGHQRSEFSHQNLLKEKSRTKRPYTKKQKIVDGGGIEKPPPKKRGRKSKKELQLMDTKAEYAQEFHPTFTKMKNRSPSQQKVQKPKKTSTSRAKKSSGPLPGPSVFDKKILAGPHLTMKQVLEYILTDHSYCVPPDPLPAVGSNHQMIRYILGPKNGAKAKSLPITGSGGEPGERSPMGYSRARIQLSLSSTPPLPSKLENLLKRGDSSPLSLGASSLRFSHSRNALGECRDEGDIDIDVESVDPEPEKRVAYDVQKAKEVMNQCEKYVEFARGADTGDNWEVKVVKTGWTKSQSGLYDKVVGALHAERLARLTYQTAGDTEPVLRRASLDKTACRVRRIFGEYLWDAKLTQWLHSVLTEFLNFAYLAIYMDVLQTLKAQCPHLVKRMMKLSIIAPLQSAYYGCSNEIPEILTPYLEETQDEDTRDTPPIMEMLMESENEQLMTCNDFPRPSTSTSQEISENKPEESEIYLPAKSVAPQVEDAMLELHSAANAVALKTLLERQWDPYAPDLLQRLKKLSHNPIFIMVAPGAIFTKLSLNRRLKQYHRMFNRVGKVVKVRLSSREALESTSTFTYLEKIVALAKEKIKDMRHDFPDRPLYIVGWGSGSILAARLSVTTGPIDGIIALGFPLHNLREMQDEILKSFGGIKHPILFVIGGLASNNSLTDMELFRRRLACETSLVIVGSGNENLYVARDHREKLLITQSYVDKTVMDEVAYFVNLHSKHNQIIAANISMKTSHFSKSHASSDGQRRSASLLRGKKRKSSFSDHEAFGGSNNEDSRDSYDSEIEKSHDGTVSSSPMKREIDSMKPPQVGAYDYGFDGPKFIPSNKSSNKRKAYYRPDPTTNIPSISSSSCITASKLLQQSPNAKRRMSKPSGPSQRVPLLNPQSTPRSSSNSGQMMEIPKDDPTALYKYLSTGTILNEQEQAGQSKTASLPLVLRQNEGPFTSGNERTAMGASSFMNTEVSTDKISKKKSASKSKGARVPKTNTPGSPASSIVSALSEVAPSASNISNSTPPSSLDMHKFVVQHQQMLRQFEHTPQDRPPSTSQLFKLLSPGAETTDNVNVSSLPPPTTANVSQGSTELVKLKLVSSQAGAGSSEVSGETRTAIISKQNLVSNISLPMIRVSRSGGVEDTSLQKPFFVSSTTGSQQSLLANLPGSSDKLVLATNDGSLMKLSQLDIQNLLKVGRNIQLFSGNPGQGPVNIIVQKPPESVEPSSSASAGSADNASTQATVMPSPTIGHHQLSIPSIIVPVTTANVVQAHNIPSSAETTKLPPTVYTPNVTSEENKSEASSGEQPVENETMDADTEEEMSGLLISSTFSVCPTSGERVIPQSTAAICKSSSGAEEEIHEPSTLAVGTSNEQFTVPIHVQPPNTVIIRDSITSGSGTGCEPQDENLLAAAMPIIISTSTDEGKDEDPEPNVKSVDILSCPPETTEPASTSIILDTTGTDNNEELLSVPIHVQAPGIPPPKGISETNEKVSRTSKKKDKHNVNVPELKTSSTEMTEESKQSSTDETVTIPCATTTENVPTCPPGKSTVPSSNLEMLASECDELLSVPIHVQSSSLAATEQNITAEPGEESPTLMKKDDHVVSESKTSSAPTSDEEKRKSKNNPVRRSARLKSGV